MQIFPKETTCMKCEILFSVKNKKNIISLPSAEFGQRVLTVTVKHIIIYIIPSHFPCKGQSLSNCI